MLQKVTFTSNCHITWPDLICTSWTRSVRLTNVEKRRKKTWHTFFSCLSAKCFLIPVLGQVELIGFCPVCLTVSLSHEHYGYMLISFFLNEWSTAGMFSQHKEVDIDNRTQIGPRHHSLGFTFLFSLTGWLRAVSLFSFSGKNQKILNMKHQKCWHRVPKQQSNNFVAGAFIYTFPKPNNLVEKLNMLSLHVLHLSSLSTLLCHA